MENEIKKARAFTNRCNAKTKASMRSFEIGSPEYVDHMKAAKKDFDRAWKAMVASDDKVSREWLEWLRPNFYERTEHGIMIPKF